LEERLHQQLGDLTTFWMYYQQAEDPETRQQ
jgi:hypothetical protein